MKLIKNFPNYSVTSTGKVWNNKYKRWLKPIKQSNGRLTVDLGHRKMQYIHRLVLEVFVGPCPEGKECCHGNGDCQDNRLENLRWATRSENIRDAVKHGTHPLVKLTERDVRTIIYMWRTKLFTQKEIAKIYNVHCTTVNKIIKKRIWKFIWSS